MENFFEQARKSFLMNLVPRRLRLLGARAKLERLDPLWGSKLEHSSSLDPQRGSKPDLAPPDPPFLRQMRKGVPKGLGQARAQLELDPTLWGPLFSSVAKRGPWIPQRQGFGYIFKKEG